MIEHKALFFGIALSVGLLMACGDDGSGNDSDASGDAGSDLGVDSDANDVGEADAPGDSGDDVGPGICGELIACGGDVVGDWDWVSWCDPEPTDTTVEGCPTAEVDSAIEPIGALTIDGDGTYRIDAVYEVTTAARIPAVCVPGGASCADVADGLNEDSDDAWTCTGADACNCTRIQELDGDQTGTWTLDGSTLTVTDDDEPEADPRPLELCVDGDAMRLRDLVVEPGEAAPIFTVERP